MTFEGCLVVCVKTCRMVFTWVIPKEESLTEYPGLQNKSQSTQNHPISQKKKVALFYTNLELLFKGKIFFSMNSAGRVYILSGQWRDKISS